MSNQGLPPGVEFVRADTTPAMRGRPLRVAAPGKVHGVVEELHFNIDLDTGEFIAEPNIIIGGE